MRMIDLDGKTVVPGFTDSHCHIFGVGEREMNLNFELRCRAGYEYKYSS